MYLHYRDGKCRGPECIPSRLVSLAARANLGNDSGVQLWRKALQECSAKNSLLTLLGAMGLCFCQQGHCLCLPYHAQLLPFCCGAVPALAAP